MTELDQTYPAAAPLRLSPAATQLDADSVRSAYARWARIYDAVFGAVFAPGRRAAVQVVNALPGREVLEVGVGTGLALPHYLPEKHITGIDLSPDMLARARDRARALPNIAALHEMDAEATSFEDDQFDIAVAMFTASVVPDPRRLLAELKRVVRPGGQLLFVNHFEADGGIRRTTERALAAASRTLGWHPDFAVSDLLPQPDRQRATLRRIAPFGLFTLVQLPNDPAA